MNDRELYEEGLLMDLAKTKARIEELEAKLAKAVELALEECPFREGTVDYDYWWQDYRTTLAGLTGGKDE